eukprot:27137-Prorocentrum_minimum.AAC.1
MRDEPWASWTGTLGFPVMGIWSKGVDQVLSVCRSASRCPPRTPPLTPHLTPPLEPPLEPPLDPPCDCCGTPTQHVGRFVRILNIIRADLLFIKYIDK